MMSLFSSFDLVYSWKSALILILFISFILCSIHNSSGLTTFVSVTLSILTSFFVSLNTKVQNKFISGMLMSTFFLIAGVNFMSVMPFNFPFNSQLSVVLFWALSVWGSFILFNTLYSFKNFASHCIPEGCPIALSWFIFLVELVSQLIRPVTLTVRLVANILAGHLLMVLLSKLVMAFMILTPLYWVLNLVEFCVGLIQSYIFCTMLALYHSEIS